MDSMSTTTTPTIVGMMANGLLIVKSGHGFYLVHQGWMFVAYGEITR